jgi:hypothetical protein
MRLHVIVELRVDLPDEDHSAGAVGTVIHIFDRPNRAYERAPSAGRRIVADG